MQAQNGLWQDCLAEHVLLKSPCLRKRAVLLTLICGIYEYDKNGSLQNHSALSEMEKWKDGLIRV